MNDINFPFLKTLTPLCAFIIPGIIQAQELPRKPNVVIILADDMGYSDLGCYGGEINTPNIDKLANNGIRFTQFYNAGRCWPTRSSLLSGYYPNAINMDPIHPQKPCPVWVKTLPQYLKEAGYKTYHSGKWHFINKPLPVGDGGFDKSFCDEANGQFSYEQLLNDKPVEVHDGDKGKYLTIVQTDHAIEFLRDHKENYGNTPFFLYLAYDAPHFPLMALQEDIDKYRERYNKGWDYLKQERWRKMKKLGLVNHPVPPSEVDVNQTYGHLMPDSVLIDSLGNKEVLYPVAWNRLTRKEKKFQSIKMTVHAAMVDRIDQETGRLIEQLKSMGAFENTLIFFLSDNGASAEIMIRGNGHDVHTKPGNDSTYLCLGPGWANASNTPFRRYKSWTHEGGISTPLIVHWPDGIKDKGKLRSNPGHIIDFIPTLLDLTGLHQVETWQGSLVPPLPGKSLIPAFAKGGTVNRDYLYFHHHGLFENDPDNRALRTDSWKIVSSGTDNNKWELYNLGTDRGEQNDRSEEMPELLEMMVKKWTEIERVQNILYHQNIKDEK